MPPASRNSDSVTLCRSRSAREVYASVHIWPPNHPRVSLPHCCSRSLPLLGLRGYWVPSVVAHTWSRAKRTGPRFVRFTSLSSVPVHGSNAKSGATSLGGDFLPEQTWSVLVLPRFLSPLTPPVLPLPVLKETFMIPELLSQQGKRHRERLRKWSFQPRPRPRRLGRPSP